MDSVIVGVFAGFGVLMALLSVNSMTEGEPGNAGMSAIIASLLLGFAACMAYAGILEALQ